MEKALSEIANVEYLYSTSQPSGGMIIVRDFILRPDKSGPLAAALFNMRMGAYTEDEMIRFLEQAGFVNSQVKRMGDYTIVTADKPE